MEDEKKQSTVYVGENDEILEVVDKIKDIHGDSVTLVIPDKAAILQDVTNLKILQRKAEQMGKEISISKSGIAGFSPEFSASSKRKRIQLSQLQKHGKMERSAGGIRPMSDMVKKGETVDLRNLKRKEGSETENHENKFFPDGYVREKYFSEEALKREEDESDALLSLKEEAATKNGAEKEAYPIINKAEEQKDEIYWRNLAEKKMAEMGEESEKFEGIFDEHGRLDPESDTKTFDFSYPENNNKHNKKKSSVLPTISSGVFAIFILLCVSTAAIALYFILPKADIGIALKEEKVSGNFNLILEDGIADIDADAGKIPVKIVEVASEQTKAFVTTSKKHVTEKARGKIIIYNECSTGPQTLVAGTRFLSQDGKVFKIEEAANVAGFTKPEDEIVPGKEIVSVVAEEAGESYNIAATSFTIPKLQELGSWKYSCLYARSEDAMAGGMDKEVAYVSQSDYDNAKATLLAAVQKENEEKVSSKKSDTEIYFSDSADAGTSEAKSSVEVGGLGESFSLTVSVKKQMFSVSKKDMENILGKKILALNTFENAQPIEGSLVYEAGSLIKKDGKFSVDVSASQSFAFKMDQNKVKAEIAGKSKEELNSYFGNMSGIKSVSVNFWPFWVNKVPENADKINLMETSEL
jgi:hypothetical protein